MASDFFIKLEGIDGESHDKAHGKWIEVIAFSLGTTQNVSTGRATDVAGRGQFQPFVFTHLVDKASPKLMQFCMSGQKISKASFAVCRAIGGAQVPVYEITMENVKVGKCTVKTVNAASHSDKLIDSFPGTEDVYLPLEEVELVAGKMTWKVTPIKPDNTKDGAVEASFNQVENA